MRLCILVVFSYLRSSWCSATGEFVNQSEIIALLPRYQSDGGRILKSDHTALHSCTATSSGVPEFYNLARAQSPVSDKVTDHAYEQMYGLFLGPMRHKKVKLLEIGLGCDMVYGPGASVQLWKKFLPHHDIWEAEYNGDCVKAHLQDGMLDGVSTLVGDQGDLPTLKKWIEKSTKTSLFDVIIDDGGHTNPQIKASFDALWPIVSRGGIYFIEDLQVGRNVVYSGGSDFVMSDVIQDWIEQLLIQDSLAWKHPLPPDVAFITCIREACAIAKKNYPGKHPL